MRSPFIYIFIFSIGLVIGLFLLNKSQKKYQSEQIEIVQNSIKNVSKLVVVEEVFTEFYNYSDANRYLFETINFEKKVILMVKAKVLVSYDLKKMQTEIDSVHKKIIIKYIPEEEFNIIPTFSYYDFQQSVFNTFTKDELNMLQKSSIDQLKKNLQVSQSKKLAKERLIAELEQLWKVSQIIGWTIEDQTKSSILLPVLHPSQKAIELENIR